MQKHLELTRQRLQSFSSNNNLGGKIYPERAPVRLSVFSAPGRITYAEAMRGNYRPARVGEQFGPAWSTHWLKVEIEIPAEWKGQEVHLLWDSSSEACVWADGQPMQGLAGSGNAWVAGVIRGEYELVKRAQGGEARVLYIELAVNGLFGFGVTGDPASAPQTGLLKQAEIAIFDREAWDLLWDFRVIADMGLYLPANTPRGGQALYIANEMVNTIQLEDRRTWPAGRKLAAEFFTAHNGDGQHNLSAIGHAHIDTAWLWPLDETKRKCARTFSTAVHYMDEYPDYMFACSQAQQWEWMKTLYPGLYERMKEKVKTGQFLPAGGSWVEPDCNIPSGEALVRQFLFGQRFFRQELGITCHEFWEPDVFGYSAALPQIMRGAEIEFFLTQKLSWNQFNKLPSHTFLWEGLDGSRVLTHFPPADTYNSMANVKEVLFNASNFKDHEHSRESYLLFGYGDGGGGPTLDMLEQIGRIGDVDGLPRVQMRSPAEFFERCAQDYKDPIVWVGELYFELHRGTYTTQSRTKRNNRRSEFLLHDAEFLSAIAHACHGRPYPKAELDRLWKIVLTNQFHDILPGSSIAEVYQDAEALYGEVLGRGTELRQEAMQAIFGQASPGGLASQSSGNICAVNTLGIPRLEVVELPEGAASPQVASSGKPLGIASAPAYGYSIFTPRETCQGSVQVTQTGEGYVLENEFVRAAIRRDGRLTSLYDKRARKESIQPGQAANRFVLFDDEPVNWDAWDVEVFHLEKRQEVDGAKAGRILEGGPLRAAVEFTYDLSKTSRLKQTISLSLVSPRLDFTTEVDWHERHKFLKVEFPLNLRAPHAAYEVQFGHLLRPTHFNTSWDMARFEVPAHKWADLSEPDFGVALLNDCKYGYATHGNVMRLSLLRAPTAPDPRADLGQQAFRYALLPHPGSLHGAGVIEEGYRFNVPMQTFPTSAAAGQVSYFSAGPSAVVLDTVKKAEDSEALIARLYEAHGTHTTARLSSSLPVRSVKLCNLLEDDVPDGDLEWKDGGANQGSAYEGGVEFEVKPFQIVTLKLEIG